jgi:hypothetical protein
MLQELIALLHNRETALWEAHTAFHPATDPAADVGTCMRWTSVPLFRLLRQFWYVDEKAHATWLAGGHGSRSVAAGDGPVVLSMSVGEEMARQRFTDAIRDRPWRTLE